METDICCVLFFSQKPEKLTFILIFHESFNNLLTNITGSSHTEEYCPLVVLI